VGRVVLILQSNPTDSIYKTARILFVTNTATLLCCPFNVPVWMGGVNKSPKESMKICGCEKTGAWSEQLFGLSMRREVYIMRNTIPPK
jgi:hypothetical protein